MSKYKVFMTRREQAIAYAKQQMIYDTPEFSDRSFRVTWWKNAFPLEKQMLMDVMSTFANSDLERVEELQSIESV